jgi:hypothetical protein
MDQNTFADADQFLSSWSGDTTPSDHGDSSPHSSNTSLGAGDLRVGNSQTFSDINQDAQLYGGDETKDIGLAMEDDSTSEMEPSTDLSQADPSPFDPQTACSESTQSGSVRSFFVRVSLPSIRNADAPPPTKTGTCRLVLSSSTGDCCASST